MFKKILHVLKHWYYFQKVAIQLHTWKLRFLFHDLDKILWILISKDVKKASHIHRMLSKHHTESKSTNPDYLQMVIDWECARYTKKDKPLNARETLYKYYPEYEKEIVPILRQLKL